MSLAIQLVIALAVFLGGFAAGVKFESGEVAKLEAAQAQALIAGIEGARTQERAYYKGVQNAQVIASKSAQVSKVAATAARAESRSLRDDLAAARTAASQSLAACNQHALTVDRLFDQCGERYTGMAETAQGHARDVKLLLDAWPQQPIIESSK
jgi:preprotein translocase subunit SecF